MTSLDFSYEFFFSVLLPFIIFESGFSMHRQSFFRNAGSILTLAIIGTFMSSLIISILVHVLSSLLSPVKYNFWDSLILGSILSSTDPVATLSVFDKVNVDTTVKSLVFGESVLNDAVSIIQLKTLGSLYSDEFTAKTFFVGCLKFSVNLVGTILIGFLMAAFISFLLKRTTLGANRTYEIIFIFLAAYASYFLSEIASLSGIVAIFCYGINTRHYTYHTLSVGSQHVLLMIFEVMKEFCEVIVFVLLGLTILQEHRSYNMHMIIITISVTLIARAIHIVILSFFMNIRRSRKITAGIQLVLWNAGLRGAVAYGLAVSNMVPNIPNKLVLITTVHACVLFTILLHGMLTLPIVKLTNVLKRDDETYTSEMSKMKIYHYWHVIDKNYITPFISNPRGYSDIETTSLDITLPDEAN
ncbi:sodium/hydrogen exchanger 8-like isoform X2 [Schistocerca gregaria]|nr:sodium/hydrogen exchanger 8-like isoform X2 [Schistocerca gregaria]